MTVRKIVGMALEVAYFLYSVSYARRTATIIIIIIIIIIITF